MNSRRPSCSSRGSRTHGSGRNNRSNNHSNRTNRRPGRSFLPPSLLLRPQNERNGSDTLSDAISALRSPKRRKKCVEEQEPQQLKKKDDDSSKPQTPPESTTNNEGSSDKNSAGPIDPNERKRKGISSSSTTATSSKPAHQQNSPPDSTTRTTTSGGWEWAIGILPPGAPKKGPEGNHRYPTRRRIPSLLYASFLSGLTASEYERQEGRISIRHHHHAGKQAAMTK